jgi:phosphate transport system permease protein
MPSSITVLVLLAMSYVLYVLGRRRALAVVGGRANVAQLHSLPTHYGLLSALWCVLPAALVLLLWKSLDDALMMKWVLASMPEPFRSVQGAERGLLLNDLNNLVLGQAPLGGAKPVMQAAAAHWLALKHLSDQWASAAVIAIGAVGGALALRRIQHTLRARPEVERIVNAGLIACSLVAIITTVGIVLSVLLEALNFFSRVSPLGFLFGTHWTPQSADYATAFGAIPLFTGTLLIALIAMLISVPVGLMSAIYLSEYASRRVRAFVKPLLELLAGIPTVVYGFFAALTVGPLLRSALATLGISMASESALAAGLVMGIMIIPFISSIADDMITAVPQSMRDGSLALGATRSETIQRVILRAALPGIAGGILLAISRAIGETMIVVMAAGLNANLTANPLQAVTTVTVQIVTLLVGDQEFNSPKTLAAFALGLVLFVSTLLLNILALAIVRKYREQYD